MTQRFYFIREETIWDIWLGISGFFQARRNPRRNREKMLDTEVDGVLSYVTRCGAVRLFEIKSRPIYTITGEGSG